MIFDTNHRTTSHISCLKTRGVTAVLRYYARSTRQPEKRLTRGEAQALIEAGISIGIVHQSGGSGAGSFSALNGKRDAEYSLDYAVNTIGQPSGSAIYFAVDYDAKSVDLNNKIIPHFRSVKAVCDTGLNGKTYLVGAYGNGLVLKRLLDDGLIKFAWMSQSTGHQGSAAFKASNRWTLFQNLPSTVCSLDVDVDELNPNTAGFGQFDALDAIDAGGGAILAGAGLAAHSATRFVVTARSGLRLRAGPGTEFDVLRLLPAGTVLSIARRLGDWAIVDLEHDGFVDGAVHSAFLRPQSARGANAT